MAKIEEKLTFQQKYLKDCVYGASDGIVTTFAIVAGVSGAALSPSIVLVLGFANLVADGFSMAVGNYLSRKSEQELIDSELKKELDLIEKYPDIQKEKVKNILEKKGFKGDSLVKGIKSVTSDKKVWSECILVEGRGLISEPKNPYKNGLATFVSFVVAGFLPLLVYVLSLFFISFREVTFELAIIATAGALMFVGLLKSGVTGRIWWKESLQMLFVGGVAAFIAYYIGYLLSLIV